MSNNSAIPLNNGAIITITKTIKSVISSAEEAKIGALFINCRESIHAWHALKEMGHKQSPTLMKSNNTTALGVFTNNTASKRVKSMNMKLHCFHCRSIQGQFCHNWHLGLTNLGDYVTKHHTSIHHRALHGTYLTPTTGTNTQQGCVRHVIRDWRSIGTADISMVA